VEIFEIESPDDHLATGIFLGVATEVYKDDPIWVPESDNLFLERFRLAKTQRRVRIWPLLALDKGRALARGAAIMINDARDKAGHPQGQIGFFEALSGHYDASVLVLRRCEEILRTAGARSVLAPKVDSLIVGLLAGGFGLPQTVFTNHNPPYYLELFLECGYRIKSKMLTFYFHRDMVRQFQIRPGKYKTRIFDRKNLSGEITIFNRLQNLIFTGRYGYVPRTIQEDQEMIESALSFIDDELIIIAEDEKGNSIGLLICLPDLYQTLKGQTLNRARVVSIGVLPGWERKGVGALMSNHLMENLIRKGYQMAEGSWIFESNILPQNLAKRFNSQPGREFLLLEKEL
jgi:GNAT superfamily N-acetyltransferase